jgi:hypothetical protein
MLIAIGTRVRTTMGCYCAGVIVPRFYWKDATDGTYRAPERHECAVWVAWDNGTRGWMHEACVVADPHAARMPKLDKATWTWSTY